MRMILMVIFMVIFLVRLGMMMMVLVLTVRSYCFELK